MSEYLIKQSTLTDIGNAIREKTGKTEQIPVINLANEISTISTGTDTSDATANAQDILSGKTAYVNGTKVTGNIPSKAAATITPGTSNQTIAAGTYLSGAQTITGDADLVAGNIKKGINIFGVDGSYDGVKLNFSVVGGTTQPANPAENTIWINTNTGITNYVFIPSEPSEPSEGMVWVSTGISGPASFNALEGNGLYIYPASAFQYINGSWAGKAAKIFKNNAWVNWETYLFNNGDVTYLSGGWKTVGGSQGAYSTGTPSNASTSTYLRASTNDSIGFLRHNTPIDLTPYTKVHFAGSASDNSGYTGTSNCCPIIMPTNSTNANDALKKQSLSAFGSFSDLQVDVTNINQEAYICWWFYDWGSMSANGTVTLTKVWLT